MCLNWRQLKDEKHASLRTPTPWAWENVRYGVIDSVTLTYVYNACINTINMFVYFSFSKDSKFCNISPMGNFCGPGGRN